VIIAATGHRPQKLDAYDRDWIREQTKRVLTLARADEDGVSEAISGMAQGYDFLFAEVVLELGIPLHAAVPCDGQTARWRPDTVARYQAILARATTVTVVTPGTFEVWKMQRRNMFMVDRCDVLLACYDGSTGGTHNCVRYAARRKKPTIQINPATGVATGI
jgi:uncharacterized phage-like protein YoqJ